MRASAYKPNSPVNPINPSTYKRRREFFVAVLITASVSGYFMGLRQTGSQISMTRPVSLVTLSRNNTPLSRTRLCRPPSPMPKKTG